MGDRGSKEQLLEREIQINGIAPKWSMEDRVVGNRAGSKGDTLAGRVGSSKCGTVNNGDVPQWIVGDRVGELFDLNGFPIPAKRNANDAIGDIAMGDSAGSKGDRGCNDPHQIIQVCNMLDQV